MRKEFMLIAIITVLSRGMPVLALPLLTASLTLEEYGLFAIYLLLINLFSPIATANIAAGIIREGIAFPHRGDKLLQIINIYSLIIALLVFCVWAISSINNQYIFVAILIITAGQQECLVSHFRSKYQDIKFFWISVSRALALAVPVIATYAGFLDLEGLLGVYCVGYVFTSLVFVPISLWNRSITIKHYVYLKMTLVYCIFLIPYTVGQWVVSSSTRAFLGGVDSLENAGLYAISYTLASPIILVFSVCGVVFGRSILADPDKWLENSEFRHRVLYGLIFVGFLCTLLSLSSIYFDYQSFQLIRYYSPEMILVAGVISMSLLFQCMYTIYGGILFYKKVTKILARNSLIIAGLHLVHSFILIKLFSIIGAVASVCVSYFLVYFLSFLDAKKETQGKLINSATDVKIIVIGLVLQILLISYFYSLWDELYSLNH